MVQPCTAHACPSFVQIVASNRNRFGAIPDTAPLWMSMQRRQPNLRRLEKPHRMEKLSWNLGFDRSKADRTADYHTLHVLMSSVNTHAHPVVPAASFGTRFLFHSARILCFSCDPEIETTCLECNREDLHDGLCDESISIDQKDRLRCDRPVLQPILYTLHQFT